MSKNDDNCCGKTVTETTSTTTKYGMAACEPERGTLQYIGARYVPIFATPAEWSRTRAYEHLMMVKNQGNTYISKQAVPVGIDLPDATGENDYWVLMSNWNAQIEQYRQEVVRLAEGLDDEETARENADTALQRSLGDEKTARENADTALQRSLGDEETARENADTALQRSLGDEETARENADTALQNDIAIMRSREIVIIGDSWSDPASVTVENNVNWVSIWQQLNRGDIIHNFAKAGRGLLTGNPTFNQQLTNAANDTSFRNDDVDMIIIVGDINDWTAGYTSPTTDYSPALRTLAQNAEQNFRNAKVYFFFASCARPLCANANISGNWNDLLGLNENLCRFINTTMPTGLGTASPNYHKMQAFNITHCFTEQTFKPWGSADYQKHLSQFGHWQLYKAIAHCISTGEVPKMRFGVFGYTDQSVSSITDLTLLGWFTPTELHADLRFTVPTQLTENGQEYIELPNSAFHVFASNTPSNFVANFDDIFPPSVNTGLNDRPDRYRTNIRGMMPLIQNAFEAKINRNAYPSNSKVYAFLTAPVIYTAKNHGIFIKHSSTSFPTDTGTYLATLDYDWKGLTEGYWYFV